MIIDSGCNRHYLFRGDFLFRTENINVPIRGVGNNKVYATKQGLFMGYFRTSTVDGKSRWFPFESFGMLIPGGAVNLFSVSQATANGDNTVVHEGKPDSGMHGLYTRAGDFIPFEFCNETQLWWIPVMRKSEETTTIFTATTAASDITLDEGVALRSVVQNDDHD